MTTSAISDSQRRAATVVGSAYLLALAPAVFAEFYVRTRLVDFADAAQVAGNVVTQERLFRLGTASNLTVFAVDVVLIVALFVLLEPVHRGLALLAAAWGLVETAILAGTTLTDLDALRILSGAGYLHAFPAGQLSALARLSLGAHDGVYDIGLVWAGLRSSAFCCLWFRSRLVPRALAAWGVCASVLMGACAFSFVVFPELARVVSVLIYGAPIFLFELTIGLWLVLRGLPRVEEMT
jgi:Domain of unknown function (DUF4386)